VDRVAQSLAPDVVRVITTLDYDWSDKLAVFFMIIVSDDVDRRGQIHAVAKRAEAAIEEQVEPLFEWDVFPFFTVRTESEQVEIERRSVA
jgi:hypothetical protein